MQESTKAAASQKAPNYTAEMEATIIAASPLNLESAKALGAEMGKGYRSIIAKAKSLGCDYISKPAPAKKPRPITKAELVQQIANGFDVDAVQLTGLEKASVRALDTVLTAIESLRVDLES